MDSNCCTECGFTTTNLSAFTTHIEQHEEDQRTVKTEWSSNSSSGGDSHRSLLSPTPPPPHAVPSLLQTEAAKTLLVASQALALDGLITAPSSHTSDEDKMLCSSSSSSGSVSPNENSMADAASALRHHAAKLLPDLPIQIAATPDAVKKNNKAAHVCPHCNFTTFMSQHMKSHLEAHERHQGQMYQCDICQMQFSQKANMHRHRMRHSGVKPYECRYCKKRFFRKDQMQEHSMTHIKTGADFDCPVAFCSLQFSQHSALRAHLEETHSITSSTPASCKRCSLLFANSRRLLLHYQTKHDEGDTSNVSVTPYSESSSPSSSPVKRRRMPPAPSTPLSTLSPHPSSLPLLSQPPPPPPALFMHPAQHSVITSLASAHNSNHFALLQSRLEEMVKLQGMGLIPPPPSSDGSSMINGFPLAAKVEDTIDRSPDFDQGGGAFTISSEELLLALSNQAHSSLFSINPETLPGGKEALRWSGEHLSAFSATSDEHSHSPSLDSVQSVQDSNEDSTKESQDCTFCDIAFRDKTLFLLHKGLHAELDPWKCNLCGHNCGDKYMFTTHIISADHSS